MSERTVVTSRFETTFLVDSDVAPKDGPIHAALRGLRALEVEAPTDELAEFYAQTLVDALEDASN